MAAARAPGGEGIGPVGHQQMQMLVSGVAESFWEAGNLLGAAQ